VINITNFTCEDNPPWPPAEPVRRPPRTTRPPLAAACSEAGQGSRVGARIGPAAGLAVAVLLSWLAFVPRRLGDHLFRMNDTEASWRGWQITKVYGGLGRRYRDPLFDALAGCSTCQGAGAGAGMTCVPCLGTGRVSPDGVS
jgi:hypothetical protein